MSASNNRPVSPCVSICALDGDDICVGCFRTGHEISYWGRLEAEQQHEVLRRCQQRMAGQPARCVAIDSGQLKDREKKFIAL